jgi:hypothetical protein
MYSLTPRLIFFVQVKAHMEALQVENDHLSREIAILRETVKVKYNKNILCMEQGGAVLCWEF